MTVSQTCLPGALTTAEMEARLAKGPTYRSPADSPANLHASVSRALWGADMHPVMSHKSAHGRFAGAALTCPATACTGSGVMEGGSVSRPYRNAAAIENIVCLESELIIAFGRDLEHRVALGRFDMVSVPPNLRHTIANVSSEPVRFLVVLSADEAQDYTAIFDTVELPVGAVGAADSLGLRFDDELGVEADAQAMLGRVVRFKTLVPYKKDLKNTSGIPSEATEMLSAGSVYPILVPEGHIGRSKTAPLYGHQGLYISIAECAPGDDGPPPHAHSDTQESFFVLEGDWNICTGFDNESAVRASQFDVIAMPNKVMRAFSNLGDSPARLFVIIQAPGKMQDTVSFSAKVGKVIEQRFGKETIDAYERIRMTFDAEARLEHQQ